MGKLAGFLARDGHHLLGALPVLVPGLGPLLVERALLRSGNHRLVLGAGLRAHLDDTGERLFRRQLLFERFREHVLADHVAIGDHPGAQLTEHAHARQPIGRDVDRAGVDRPHIPNCKQAHARQRDEQERNRGNDLGADREFGEHYDVSGVPGSRGPFVREDD